MRKVNSVKQEDEGRRAEIGYLRERCLKLEKQIAQRDAVINLIVKAAYVIEQERDELQRIVSDDQMPF